MTVDLIEVTQPIGTFYMTCLPAQIVAQACDIVRRDVSGKGIQRVLSKSRVNDISTYTADPDATFPTPIIIAVYPESPHNVKGLSLSFDENAKLGEIIDGQHRVEGLKKSPQIGSFELPVILMFNLVEEEKAYVFSIINSKQTPVSKSLIYDLFSLAEERSPQKSCHDIARLMNSDEASPYFQRLKMLGRKEGENSSLSQGSFAKHLLRLISRKPDQDLIDLKRGKKLQNDSDDPSTPFRYYFVNNEDRSIYKILLNLFRAVASIFPEEWNKPDEYILSKTTGYGALMRALPTLVAEGSERHSLTQEFFDEKMHQFHRRLAQAGLSLKSLDFPSNEQQQARLAEFIKGSP